jgi:hypothetical protein
MKVCKNMVLRRTLLPNGEAVAGGWGRLHNEELRNLYASPHIIRMDKSRRMRWAEHLAPMTEMRNEYNILVGKSERKRQLGRPKRRREDKIRMEVREIRWKVAD